MQDNICPQGNGILINGTVKSVVHDDFGPMGMGFFCHLGNIKFHHERIGRGFDEDIVCVLADSSQHVLLGIGIGEEIAALLLLFIKPAEGSAIKVSGCDNLGLLRETVKEQNQGSHARGCHQGIVCLFNLGQGFF